MDDLTRIESIYGSVAEYNRVRFEENQEPISLSATEKLNNACKMAIYEEKIRLLSGTPSDFAKDLVAEWAKLEPKESDFSCRNEYIRHLHDHAAKREEYIAKKICEYHHVNCDTAWATFYRPGLNQFAISVQYDSPANVVTLSIGPMSYEQFKPVFCDLHFARLSPTMCYENKEEYPFFVSNSSLGSIRMSYLSSVESKEELNEELKLLGFDEEEFTEKYKEEHENDYDDDYDEELTE